ncbi:methyltransferase domain-containing protein [Dactylosporangium sp. NPDC051485]|uniref:methyltransferase domain-containing protein n=1 Tax=Dactylosporangium sp. NPDC051485 TaxID=3154846 RepID=UPI003420F111
MTGTAAEPGPHPIHHALARRLADPGGGVVVDLGCGPGRTLIALHHRWPGTRLIGIDLQPAPLATAGQTDAGARLLLVRADLAAPLPLDDAGVTALVCHNVIELLPRPAVLFAEAHRVLRRGGQAVWSHTDFAGLVIHGADPQLTDRICQAYAEVSQRWMAHIDPRAGRAMPGLARRAGLTVDAFDAHVLTADRLTGHASLRIDEITQVAYRHAAQQRAAVTVHEVQAWRAQLDRAHADGEFCFAETAFITTTSRTDRD